MDTFGLSAAAAAVTSLLLVIIAGAAVVWVILSAPPKSITITAGPEGSTFRRWADTYQKELAQHGIELKILSSSGSLDNLQRLRGKDSPADIGFVQGGLTEGISPRNLVSLGSVAYQPLMVFYRGETPVARLSEFAGKRLALGHPGSGTRVLATTLLQANGVSAANATLTEDDAGAAAASLLEGKLDAVFLMGDSAPIQTLRTLIRSPDVQILDFVQADAYVRRYDYLNRVRLPQGAIDFGKNLPAHDISLVGPTVELIARKGLNPAISDLLLDIAQKVHGRPTIMQRRGEFPAPLVHEFAISDDALRYYKSGKGFIYRIVGSFWLASLLNRVLVAFVPVLIVVIPALRLLPIGYRLRIQLRIYRCYRPLLQLERDASGPLTRDRIRELLHRLDEIEQTVNRVKVPASFADQFYELRGHILFVRKRLKAAMLA